MAEPFEVDVPKDGAGGRVDRFLARLAEVDGPLVGLTRSRLKKLITDGAVHVDGRAVRASHKLLGGETVTLRLPPPEPLELEPEAVDLDVLFEDENLIAINKPAGLVVHPGAGRTRGTLVHALLAHCTDLSGIGGKERPGIVHRLDKDTSGVIVVAKHDRAHVELSRQFSEREVTKRYVAFVIGTPTPSKATLDTPYARHPKHRKKYTGRVGAKRRAVTDYEVVDSGGGIARLAILLGTGRTHQIRVHLSELGNPVVADTMYGGRQWQRIKNRALLEVATALERHALHAASIKLRHPMTDKPMKLIAPLPEDLEELDAAMRAAARE